MVTVDLVYNRSVLWEEDRVEALKTVIRTVVASHLCCNGPRGQIRPSEVIIAVNGLVPGSSSEGYDLALSITADETPARARRIEGITRSIHRELKRFPEFIDLPAYVYTRLHPSAVCVG